MIEAVATEEEVVAAVEEEEEKKSTKLLGSKPECEVFRWNKRKETWFGE